MIPLSDDAPRKGMPWVTLLLLLLNLAAFLHVWTLPPLEAEQVYLRLGCIPREIVGMTDAGPAALVPLPFTLVTTLFLHGGWIHLLANLLFLWVFGKGVEARLGRAPYTVFFISCGVAATLVHVVFHAESGIPVVGASGAVSAVMAAYLAYFPTARIKTLVFWFVFFQVVRIPALVFLGAWVGVQVLAGLSQQAGNGGVAWFAHLGGFAAGLAVGLKTRNIKPRASGKRASKTSRRRRK